MFGIFYNPQRGIFDSFTRYFIYFSRLNYVSRRNYISCLEDDWKANFNLKEAVNMFLNVLPANLRCSDDYSHEQYVTDALSQHKDAVRACRGFRWPKTIDAVLMEKESKKKSRNASSEKNSSLSVSKTTTTESSGSFSESSSEAGSDYDEFVESKFMDTVDK